MGKKSKFIKIKEFWVVAFAYFLIINYGETFILSICIKNSVIFIKAIKNLTVQENQLTFHKVWSYEVFRWMGSNKVQVCVMSCSCDLVGW